MKFAIYLRQTWFDPRLADLPGKGNKFILLPNGWEKVWIPDTFIPNADFVKNNIDPSIMTTRLMKVNSTGTVWYVTR